MTTTQPIDRQLARLPIWRVLRRLKITQGPLTGRTIGETAPPWQRQFILDLYGTKDPATGRRRYQEAFLKIAKKNGKSTLLGTLAVAHVIAHPEDRGLVLMVAGSQNQAGLLFEAAATVIEAEPVLLRDFHLQRYRNKILHKPTGTEIRAVASNLESLVGKACHLAIFDELWVLGRLHLGETLYRQATGGSLVFAEPLVISISTAPAYGVQAGIYSNVLARARRVLEDPDSDPQLLARIYEHPVDADPGDADLYHLSNPSLEVTVPRSWLVAEYRRAAADPNPTALQNFQTQHLNQEIADNVGIQRWIGAEQWDAAANPEITLDWMLRHCQHIYPSIDKGGLDDPTALGLLGVDATDRLYYLAFQWLTRAGYEKNREAAPYDEFIRDGSLQVVERINEDLDAAVETIRYVRELVPLICIDAMGMKSIVRRLEGDGHQVFAVRQGFALTPYIRFLETAIAAGTLQHDGGAMLAWNIANVRLQARGGGTFSMEKPSLSEHSARKIDGAICMTMAVAGYEHMPPGVGKSVYENEVCMM